MTHVAVVGSLNMDFTVGTDRLPRPGETVSAESFATAPGGKGANQCVAAARQGVSTAMVGAVGNDPFGADLRDLLADEGTDVAHVVALDDTSSGVAFVTVDGNGDNTIVVAPQANGRLLPSHIEEAADVIGHSDVLLCQLEVPLDTVESALRTARDRGVRTLLNPAPAVPLPDELLELVDLLLPNETEAAALTGVSVTSMDTAREAADDLIGRGCGAVVVTLGEIGAVYRDADRTIPVSPVRVDAVDVTAAGDAFCGTLAAALAGSVALDASLLRAAAAGALTVTEHGAQPSIPTRDATRRLLERVVRPDPGGV